MGALAVQFTGADLEEVFVYRSSIYAWTFNQQLRVYSIPSLESAIRHADKSQGDAVCYWLFHARGFGSTPEQRHVKGMLNFEVSYRLEVDFGSIPYRQVRFEADPGSVLDMDAYYDTLYLASDGGLFASPLRDLESDSAKTRPSRPVAPSCLAVSAGSGAIAASCGTLGLHMVFDSFVSPDKPARQVSDISVRAEVGAGSVVNHLSRSEFQFLAGRTRYAREARGKVLTDVAEARVEGAEDRWLQVDEEAFTLWDSQRLVVFEPDGVRSIGVNSNLDVRRLGRSRHLSSTSMIEVLSACRVGSSFLAEGPRSVTIASNLHSPVEIHTGPIVGLRSYQRSMRYGRLATVTSETGLWLISITPEEEDSENNSR